MGRRKYPLIHLEGVQIKSKKKLRLLCKCINTLEEELGIKEVEISFKNVFVCPWIDLTQFSNSNDPMEKLIGGILLSWIFKDMETSHSMLVYNEKGQKKIITK